MVDLEYGEIYKITFRPTRGKLGKMVGYFSHKDDAGAIHLGYMDFTPLDLDGNERAILTIPEPIYPDMIKEIVKLNE